MTYDDLDRIPCFIIPVDDARSVLFSERRIGRQIRARLFEGSDGVRRFSPDVYFGTMLTWPGDDERDYELIFDVINACESTASQDAFVVRLDYAYDCLSKEFVLLRVGTPKSAPIPYSELDPGVVENAERFIKRFMEKPHIDILAERQQAIGDGRILFEGEETFLEGFLGDSGLPLVLPEELEAQLKNDADEFAAAQ